MPSSLNSGGTAFGTVTLSNAAPKGGFFVILSGGSNLLSMMPSVRVAQGNTSGVFRFQCATFYVSTVQVSVTGHAISVTITKNILLSPSPSLGYPLKVGPTGRYLVNQSGKPVLLVGDAPQALIVNLSVAQADAYFADRAAHGFNALWINLLCATYTGGRSDGSTFDGIVPFTTPFEFSSPNEAYFARCDAILNLAARHGITVLLDPAETGSFLSVMLNNGTTKCFNYGKYLGNRYKNFDNIIWLSGNDYQNWNDSSSDAVVTSVAKGIKSVDSRHIHTIELDYFLSSSLNDPNWAPIVSLNAAYTYYPTYAEILRDYNAHPKTPAFLIEADYEFENGTDNQRLRREQYWSYLSGGAGQIYGNHYIWPFVQGWQQNLDTPGVTQLGYAEKLMNSVAWFQLVPDQNHQIVTGGFGIFSSGGSPHSSVSENNYVTAAATPDGRLMIAYVPTSATVLVNLSKFKGRVSALWFDPTSGKLYAIAGSPFANSGTHSFAPPGANGEGMNDWVLVLKA